MKLDGARYNCGMFASIKYRLIGEESNRESIKRRCRVSRRALAPRCERQRSTESKRNNNFLRFATCEFVWISCILLRGERETPPPDIRASCIKLFFKESESDSESERRNFRNCFSPGAPHENSRRFAKSLYINCCWRELRFSRRNFVFFHASRRALARRRERVSSTVATRIHDACTYVRWRILRRGNKSSWRYIRANIISIELPRLIVRK